MTRALAVAAGVALALRLLFALGYWTGQPLTRDEREYLAIARGLTTGHGFSPDPAMLAGQPEPFGRAPGYPLFLALTGAGAVVPSAVPVSVKIAQAVLGAVGVVLVGLIATRLAGSRAGLAAALIAACYPPLVWISAYAYSEAIAWPIGLAVVWVFDRRAADRSGVSSVLAAGALTGAAILIRPGMIIFLALAALWLMIRRAPSRALAFAVAAVFVVAPWTIRNYLHEGRFVAVASEGGVTFWTGNHPHAIGEGDLAANPELKRDALVLRAQHPTLTEDEMERVYYHEAFGWIGAHPWRWLALEIRKIFYLVVPIGPSYRLHSFRYLAASLLSYGLLLPAAVIGFWRARPRRGTVPGLWLLGGSAVLMCLIFFPQERFRIPMIDPVLVVCAACSVAGVRQGDA
jgi:4-amino-4-deoxy-L-arabinose transferase-like glycosyltransferase